MIFRDQHNLLVNETFDGMDSCFRAGIWHTFSDSQIQTELELYVDENGICVRHPKHKPSNNPQNFSKDQLIPLMSALYNSYGSDLNRKILKATMKRFFFAQNFERDWPGTKKFPWPHKMQGGDPADNGRWRMFDFADPLFWPHYLYFFAKASRLKWLEVLTFIPGAATFLVICLLSRLEPKSKETNQLLCMLKTLGHPWPEIYKCLNPNWFQNVMHYWNRRNEPEYADKIGANFL